MPKLGLCFRAAVAVLVAGFATVANAAPVRLDFSVGYGDGQVQDFSNPEGNATADDYAAEGQFENEAFKLDWDLSGKYDPTINGAFSVTNNLAVPQTFTLSVTVPVPPIAGGTVIGGSVGGSFTDANGGGATFGSSGGTAIYTALVDGVPVATLYPSPVALAAGPFLTTNLLAADFGSPIPSAAGPAALTTDMGIELKFVLSPGDTAALTSVFVVEPVPEPSTIVLALMGLGCGLFVARRRSRA